MRTLIELTYAPAFGSQRFTSIFAKRKIIKSAAAIALLLILSLGNNALASQADPLFVIARSTNANTVHYVAYLTSRGAFDMREPISAYWIMSAEDGHREDLTSYEENHIYGFSIHRDVTGQRLTLTIKSMEHLPIHVSLVGGVAQAEAEISGHAAVLKNVFVQMSGGLIPSVKFIKLSGTDASSGKPLEEIIHP